MNRTDTTNPDIAQILAGLGQNLEQNAEPGLRYVQLDARLQQFDELLRNLLSQNLPVFAQQLVYYLCRELNCVQGVLYVPEYDSEGTTGYYVPAGAFACPMEKLKDLRFLPGQTLAGQVAKSQEPIVVSDLLSAQFEIKSSLVRLYPQTLLIYPILFNKNLQGVVELVSLHKPQPHQFALLGQLLKSAAAVLQSVLNNLQTQHHIAKLEHLKKALQQREQDMDSQARELEKARSQLQENLQHLQSTTTLTLQRAQWVVQASPIGMLVADHRGNIVAANAAAARLVHRSEPNLLQTTVFKILGSAATGMKQLARELDEARKATFDYQIHLPDGTSFMSQVELVALQPGTDSTESYYALYILDVSSRYNHFTL